jgi:hypothetical protein
MVSVGPEIFVAKNSKSISIEQSDYSNCIRSFGFEDHISQPQIRGLDPQPGPREPQLVPPG